MLQKIQELEERILILESKLENDFEIADVEGIYSIEDKFELSRFNFKDAGFRGVQAVGEIKSLNKSYSIVILNLIVYDEKGNILDKAGISFRDLKEGQAKTFEVSPDVDDINIIDGFKIEIDSL